MEVSKKRTHKIPTQRDLIKTFVKDCLAILEEKKLRQIEWEHKQEIRIALGLLPDLP